MSKYSTPKLLKKKRIRRCWRWSLTVSFLIVILYAVSFWSSHDSLQIKNIEVTGNYFLATEEIEEVVQEAVSRKLFLILDRNNFVFLPREVIARKVQDKLQVKIAIVRIVELDKLEIEVVEHKPWATWCRDDQCYFVNEKGLAFVEEDEEWLDGLVYLEGEASEGYVLGQIYSTPQVFPKLVLMQQLLQKISINLHKISTEDFETFTLHTREGPYLLVDNKDDPIEVVNNLKTTLEQESIHEIQFKNIEYFDLRFDDKAYYKIK